MYEDQKTAFKEFMTKSNVNLDNKFYNIIAKYICAFLNVKGGSLYLGITSEAKVKGLSINLSLYIF